MMQDVLAPLTAPDYAFLVELVESPVNLTDDVGLHRRLRDFEEEGSPDARAALDRALEREIRYLGSSDAAYLLRKMTGQEPGVPFREIVRDVARALKIELPAMGTDRELLVELVERYATREFANLTPDEQQRMLVDLGVDKEKAKWFVVKSAGVFSVPLLIAAFDAVVVQGLIKTVIFGAIARLVGSRLSAQLFALLAARMPWWLSWVGPAAWTVSIGWTALDLQGPAMRKTMPVVLFLGLCALRERGEAG